MTGHVDPDGGPVVAVGDLLAPGYRVLQHIARGEALDVYEVFSEQRLCSCIAKTPRPDRAHQQRVRDRLWQEGRLLQSLAHPHLLRGFETVGQPVPVLVTETLPSLSLADRLAGRRRRFPALWVALLGVQLSSAVHYLHGSGFLHLDIRPANVVVDAGLATLIDLSLARPPGPAPRGVGTREHLSPEQARGGNLTAAADVWGIGGTLYEAATGVRPFGARDAVEQGLVDGHGYVQLRRTAPPLGAFRRRLPSALSSVVEQCLAIEPADRPTVPELWRAMTEAVDDLLPG